MIVNDFLTENIERLITDVIGNLDSEFNSHQFIQVFSKKFEAQYIDFLVEYKGTDAFKTVNSEIAKFLKNNNETLCICKTRKVKSRNIFGDISEAQGWLINRTGKPCAE